MEVVACPILMKERGYITADKHDELYKNSEKLSAKLLAMKNYLKNNYNVNEEGEDFDAED